MTDETIHEAQPESTQLTWPTTEQFMNETTRDESVALAAVEILGIQAGLIKALERCSNGIQPVGVKMLFEKKLRRLVSHLYDAIPPGVQQQVEYVVMVEQFGGPEAVEKMMAAEQAADATSDVVADMESSETVNLSPSGQEGSIPSNITTLPKIPEQWPATWSAEEGLKLTTPEVAQQVDAKVLPFKRPAAVTPPQDTPPEGGSPIAMAA